MDISEDIKAKIEQSTKQGYADLMDIDNQPFSYENGMYIKALAENQKLKEKLKAMKAKAEKDLLEFKEDYKEDYARLEEQNERLDEQHEKISEQAKEIANLKKHIANMDEAYKELDATCRREIYAAINQRDVLAVLIKDLYKEAKGDTGEKTK